MFILSFPETSDCKGSMKYTHHDSKSVIRTVVVGQLSLSRTSETGTLHESQNPRIYPELIQLTFRSL